LAVASRYHSHVKLFCPRTGLLCQEIAYPPLPPHLHVDAGAEADFLTMNLEIDFPPPVELPLVSSLSMLTGVLALLRRDEGGAEPEGSSGRRPHFLVLHAKQVQGRVRPFNR
jgi:hypothetical protein